MECTTTLAYSGSLLTSLPWIEFLIGLYFLFFRVFSAIIIGGFALGSAASLAPDYSKAKFACSHLF